MDDRLRLAMGYPKPPALLYSFSGFALSSVGFFQRYFMLPRSEVKTLAPIGKQGLAPGVALNPLDSLGVCPASGAKGKTCPVGGHQAEVSKPRLTPNWFDNEPHYSRAATKLSATWLWEQIFVKVENRRGAKQWRPAGVLKKDLPVEPVAGLDCGYRVEELGPKGLEKVGMVEVYKEARLLNGGKELEGVWGMENPETSSET